MSKLIEENIKNTDWESLSGPSGYNSKNIADALIKLVRLESQENSESVANSLVNVIGNSHKGVYYPVVLKALDYIISIEESSDYRARKICSVAILNDLYYFEPFTEGYTHHTAEEIKEIVLKKLEPYSDENIEDRLRQ